MGQALTSIAEMLNTQQTQIATLQAQLTQGNNDFAALKFAIDSTATGNPRPPAIGGAGVVQTDF